MKNLSIDKKNEELKDNLISLFKYYAVNNRYDDWMEDSFHEDENCYQLDVPYLGNSLLKKLVLLDANVHVSTYDDFIVVTVFKYI